MWSQRMVQTSPHVGHGNSQGTPGVFSRLSRPASDSAGPSNTPQQGNDKSSGSKRHASVLDKHPDWRPGQQRSAEPHLVGNTTPSVGGGRQVSDLNSGKLANKRARSENPAQRSVCSFRLPQVDPQRAAMLHEVRLREFPFCSRWQEHGEIGVLKSFEAVLHAAGNNVFHEGSGPNQRRTQSP
jgi:hypothetical protein